VLDVRQAQTHDAVGDRAFGHDPNWVAAMGRAMLDGLAQAGIVGVVKHLPGLGRATVDSHHDLPHISASAADLACDLAPFQVLADAPMGMVGHIAFDAWDAHRPASQSAVVIDQIIRKTIGFGGLLLTDDLHMDALSGMIADRAAAALAAGCDIAMACWARGDDVRALSDAVPDMAAATSARLTQAMVRKIPDTPFDINIMLSKRDMLLAVA
jgi:beta-N-acetylhexosaminidase